MHPQADLMPVSAKRRGLDIRPSERSGRRCPMAIRSSADFPTGAQGQRPGAAALFSVVLPQSVPLIGLRPAHAQAFLREQASHVLPVRKTREHANIKLDSVIAEPFRLTIGSTFAGALIIARTYACPRDANWRKATLVECGLAAANKTPAQRDQRSAAARCRRNDCVVSCGQFSAEQTDATPTAVGGDPSKDFPR
jgi:hypothetical protein